MSNSGDDHDSKVEMTAMQDSGSLTFHVSKPKLNQDHTDFPYFIYLFLKSERIRI